MVKILSRFWNSWEFITDSIFANIRFLWKIFLGCNVFSLIFRIKDISGFSFEWIYMQFQTITMARTKPIFISVKIPKYLQSIFFCYIFLKRYTRNFGFLEVFIVTNLKLPFDKMLKKILSEEVVSCLPKGLCLLVFGTASTIRVCSARFQSLQLNEETH